MYSWRYKEGDKFWLIFNYSKVVWDINTKFSPVSALIRFQLFTKFERHSLKNEAAIPLTIKNFSRAWQGHFFRDTLQTWQIFFFFVDAQMILLSPLDTLDCLKKWKNKKQKKMEKVSSPPVQSFLSQASFVLDPLLERRFLGIVPSTT